MNLFFHQAALGDFVLTFPLLRTLTQADASPPLTVIAPWGKAELAAALFPPAQPLDIELFEFTRLHSPAGPSALSPAVAELFQQATRILSFVGVHHSPWPNNVKRLAPQAELLLLDPRPNPQHPDEHALDATRRQLTEQHADLPLLEHPKQPVGDPAGPLVIHPGSGGNAKCWPPPHYQTLIEQLLDAGLPVRPILGEVELDRWPQHQLNHWTQNLHATVCRSPSELLTHLQSARGLIGNDAGPTHLAAQLGLTTLALFGPSNPKRWKPLGPNAHTLAPPEPQAIDWLTTEHATQTARALFS